MPLLVTAKMPGAAGPAFDALARLSMRQRYITPSHRLSRAFAALARQRWLKLNNGQGWQRMDADERADWCRSIAGDPAARAGRLAPAQSG